MCFEFEAIYWAKLAEEEEKRKEAEKQRKAAQAQAKPQRQPANDEDLLPV
jgi:hypothetical protein